MNSNVIFSRYQSLKSTPRFVLFLKCILHLLVAHFEKMQELVHYHRTYLYSKNSLTIDVEKKNDMKVMRES